MTDAVASTAEVADAVAAAADAEVADEVADALAVRAANLSLGRTRASCTRCRRPASVCLCDCLPDRPLRCETDIVIVQHAKEARKGIRTSQLLESSLERLRIFVGVSEEVMHPAGLASALEPSAASLPVLLYPADDAILLDGADGPARLARLRGGRELVLVAIDGTWNTARQLYAACPALAALPRVALGAHGSERVYHALRHEPSAAALSTLESLGRSLALIEGERGARVEAALRRPLRRFVEQQQAFQAQGCPDLALSKTRAAELDPSLTREQVLRNQHLAVAAGPRPAGARLRSRRRGRERIALHAA